MQQTSFKVPHVGRRKLLIGLWVVGVEVKICGTKSPHRLPVLSKLTTSPYTDFRGLRTTDYLTTRMLSGVCLSVIFLMKVVHDSFNASTLVVKYLTNCVGW